MHMTHDNLSSAADARDALHVLEIEFSEGQGAVVEEILTAHDQPYALWEHRDKTVGSARIYCDSATEAQETETKVRAWLNSWAGETLDPMPSIVKRLLPREDWAESWKKHFTTARVSDRVVIKPTWENYNAGEGEVVVEIDPGMSFGTGQHGTTKACLQFMDELNARLGKVSFLDAGCGSGILSLAAWKLGFGPLFAFDNDPAAVEVARTHLAEAPAEDVAIACSEIADYTPPRPCRVVVANILAVVLLKNAEKLVSFLDAKEGASAHLVLSGILEKQYIEIRERFCDLGLTETSTRLIDEWKSGCFELRYKR